MKKIALAGNIGFVKTLSAFLEKNNCSVYTFDPVSTALPALVNPSVLFHFLENFDWIKSVGLLSENINNLEDQKAKIVVVGNDLSYEQKIQLEARLKEQKVPCIKISLTPLISADNNESLEEILKMINSQELDSKWITLVVSNKSLIPLQSTINQNIPSAPRIIKRERSRKIVFSNRVLDLTAKTIFFGLFLFLIATIAAILSVAIPLYKGINDLEYVRNNLSVENSTDLHAHLNSAFQNFDSGQGNLAKISPVFYFLKQEKTLGEVDNLISLVKITTDVGNSALISLPMIKKVADGIIDPSAPTYSVTALSSLKPEIEKMQLSLGQAQIKLEDVSPFWRKTLIPGKYRFLQKTLSDGRVLLSGISSILDSYNSIFGTGGKKSYLIILQNPAELRPTGGFIGSFAILSFDQGKLVSFRFNDIYAADGQLKGRISPPDEILYYLGQPNWYMRDGNWAPDFPLTAARLKWFLEKETGELVDGVIAVDIHTVEKILKVTGPVKVIEFDDEVSSSNLYEKAQFRSEINFFPGSSQKRDFLNSVATAIVGKITFGRLDSPTSAVTQLVEILSQKNLLFFFDDAKTQSLVEKNNWAGQVKPPICNDPTVPCVMVVDANLGANKANYYLTRSFDVNAQLSKDGDETYNMIIKYKNNSPSNTWPGGDYKNYLRILVPFGSQLNSFDLGDGRAMQTSTVLDQNVIASVSNDKFLVKIGQESVYTSWGTIMLVPVAGEKTVTLNFTVPQKLDYKSNNMTYKFAFLKQPGTSPERFNFTLEHPSFLKPKSSKFPSILDQSMVFEQKIIYNTLTDTDKLILVPLILNQP